MAEIITAKGTGFFIEKVIRGARERIVLISPYLKVQKLYLDELKAAAKRGVSIKVVFRKEDAKKDQIDALLDILNVELFQLPELHAKCYFNEHRLVITSMNLHDHSERTNQELGIMLEDNDHPLFQEAVDRALGILAIAEPLAQGKQLSRDSRLAGWDRKPSKVKGPVGYCIRTGEQIAFNVEKPLSYEAYLIWSQYGDPDYPEKYCHFSGEPSHGDTSVARPILKKNWKKAKEIFDV